MKEAEVEQYKCRLAALQSELLELEGSSKEATRPVELDQASIGRLSRMDAMQAQQMAQETARRRRRQLQRIEGALRRIEAGAYGNCFLCSEEIDVRRLSVDPTTTRCIQCVEKEQP